MSGRVRGDLWSPRLRTSAQSVKLLIVGGGTESIHSYDIILLLLFVCTVVLCEGGYRVLAVGLIKSSGDDAIVPSSKAHHQHIHQRHIGMSDTSGYIDRSRSYNPR